LKSFIAAAGLGIAFKAFISNIEEAEAAASQLDAAFKATGANARLTRSSLDDLASSIQRTTTYSDDLVKQAESILLTFRQVRGDAFERTIKVSTDLAARLGIDLVSAVRQVGRAINDPVQGLSLLRRSGIQFTESQAELIKRLVETGQAAKAQELILTELEGRYKGAAAAARNTLGGSLAGLKNAFGDLFEGTKESTSGLVKSINGISEALSDPKIKEGIDVLVTGLLKIVELTIRSAGAFGSLLGKMNEISKNEFFRSSLGLLGRPVIAAIGALTDDGPKPRIGGAGHGGSRIPRGQESFDDIPAVATLEEFTVTVKKIKDEYGDVLKELEESTRTSTQNQAAEFLKLKTTLEFLRDEKLITGDEFTKRLSTATDELLPEFDLNEIRAKYKSVKAETTEMGEFMKGVWQGVGQSIQATLSDALYEWKFSFKSLLDITRRALADIASAIITSGIKKALQSQLSSSSSSSSGGWLKALGQLFGFAAGGGSQRGPRIVGEDGPELAMGSERIYNRRQMAFAGMGSSINFAPVTNITLIERDNPDKTKQEIFQTVAIQNARQQAEFIRTLQRSGVEVKG
jgi:hypothetical protein